MSLSRRRFSGTIKPEFTSTLLTGTHTVTIVGLNEWPSGKGAHLNVKGEKRLTSIPIFLDCSSAEVSQRAEFLISQLYDIAGDDAQEATDLKGVEFTGRFWIGGNDKDLQNLSIDHEMDDPEPKEPEEPETEGTTPSVSLTTMEDIDDDVPF